MECRKRMSAGTKGTKQYLQRFGDRLLYVRYRHDQERQRRVTTVEIIVDEKPLPPLPHRLINPNQPFPNQNIYVRIDFNEKELRTRAKSAGAKWQPNAQRWLMPYRIAVKLGLKERVEQIEVSNNGQ